MNDLNLLPSSAKFQAERIRLKMVINNFLWLFGGLWVLLLVGVFLVELVLNFNLKKLNNDYKTYTNQYQSMIGSVALSQKIKYQAKIVAKVLSDRFEYGKSIKLVKGLFPSDVVVNDLKIVNKKSFNISGGVSGKSGMSEVEDLVDEINAGSMDDFKSAKLNGVSVDAVKGWKFEMEVELS